MAVEQITYKNIDPKVRSTIMAGLVFAMLIACLDGTIVGTIGAAIVEDLKGFDLYSWMITSYLLCETIMIPLAGKLSDLYGRKPLFLIGLFLFVGGSFLAGMSSSMEMFIICRGIQGLGAGTLIPVATASVADLYDPEARAKIQGALGAVFGIGSGIGPLLGAFILESVSWHWAFYINIPLAAVAFALTFKKFPTPISESKPNVDVKGMAFLSLMILALIILIEFGGNEFAWVSVESMLLIAAVVVCLLIFIMIERKAVEPVLSPRLLKNRTVILSCIFMFIFGIGMMGAMTYANLFAIKVLGFTFMEAGTYSLAMVAGMMITAMSSGALVNKTGYKVWLISGPIIVFISMVMMSTMDLSTGPSFYALALFVLGFGLGCMMAVIMTAVQNSSKETEMGMTTSSVNLVRAIGCTMGTAIFSMIINSKMDEELLNNLGAEAMAYINSLGFTGTGVLNILEYLDQAMQTVVLTCFCNSVSLAFLAGGAIMLFLVVIGVIFKAVTPAEVAAAEGDAPVDQVTEE